MIIEVIDAEGPEEIRQRQQLQTPHQPQGRLQGDHFIRPKSQTQQQTIQLEEVSIPFIMSRIPDTPFSCYGNGTVSSKKAKKIGDYQITGN